MQAITTQDGRGLALNILGFSENQTCRVSCLDQLVQTTCRCLLLSCIPMCNMQMWLQDPDAFVKDMTELFESLDLNDISEHTSEIMQAMMEKIRHHQARQRQTVLANPDSRASASCALSGR